MKTLALFNHHPECSNQCCFGMMRALEPHYRVKWFDVRSNLDEVLDNVDGLLFPGGIGDSDSYFDFFTRTKANKVASFIAGGGRYIGICMGAYWAGSRYFDLLDRVDAIQYIKHPTAEIKRSYGTVANIEWLGRKEKMFFYDGCTYVGSGKYETVASYADRMPMAIIQGNIGIIGCHPESEEFWYETPYQYISKHWHNGVHHQLLLEFVNKLMERGQDGNAAVC